MGAEKKEYAARHILREKFWSQFLEKINSKHSFCANISPSTDNWIPVALGMSGVSIWLVISKKYTRVEVYINRGDKEENKRIFDYFYSSKNKIENDFGGTLIWERMEDNVTSRIKHQLDGVGISSEADWDRMNEFLIDGVVRMLKAFKEPVKNLKK